MTGPLAGAYVSMLLLVKTSIRVLMMVYFTMRRNPKALWIVFLIPAILLLFGCIRLPRLLKAAGYRAAQNAALGDWIHDACQMYQLIADYMQRPQVEEVFHSKVVKLSDAQVQVERIIKNNELFARSLAPLCVGIYVIAFASAV